MHLTTLFLSAIAASTAVAKRSCGAPALNSEQSLIAQNFQLHEASARRFALPNSTTSANTTVKVYWHVVALDKTVTGGYLAQSALDAQLQVLNDAYEPQGVAFVQAAADWTVNPEWANDTAEVPMKTALRKGTYADMNVYWVANSQYLGYAYYPVAIDVTSEEFILDGIVAVASSVPGGTAPYDLGHTLTHEAGHWFGRKCSPINNLFQNTNNFLVAHTFGEGDGSCSGDGDFVSDTAFEASAAFGCEVGRDTCPNDPGVDPITNYMDYSDDACFTGFTDGQTARIVSYWDSYRKAYAS
jgi:hypothetical protein